MSDRPQLSQQKSDATAGSYTDKKEKSQSDDPPSTLSQDVNQSSSDSSTRKRWNEIFHKIDNKWSDAVRKHPHWPRAIYCVLGALVVGLWFIVV
jgi:hypothetical protein